jgi:hypothetical protein
MRKPLAGVAKRVAKRIAEKQKEAPPGAEVKVIAPPAPTIEPEKPSAIERIIEKAAPVVTAAAPAVIPSYAPPPPSPSPVPSEAEAPVTVERAGLGGGLPLLLLGGVLLLAMAGKRR